MYNTLILNVCSGTTQTCITSPLSQDGVELQTDSISLDNLWLTGMDAYRASEWEMVIDQLEEAIRVFNSYENHSLACLQECREKREEGEWWVVCMKGSKKRERERVPEK